MPRPPHSSGWSVALLSLLACFAWNGTAGAATEVLYIADLTGKVHIFDAQNGIAGSTISNVLLNGAVGVVQEDNGDILVSTVNSDAIQRLNHVNWSITTLSAGNLIKNPDGIARIGSEVFIADPEAHAILGVNTTTGAQRTVVNGGLSFGGPWICAAKDGFLYVSRNSNSSIVRVDPATGAEVLVTSEGLLSDIVGIGSGPDGYLYVACYFTGRVVRVDPTNGLQSIASQGNYLFRPFGLGVGPDNYVWVTLDHTDQVVKVHPVSGTQVLYHVAGMTQPYGILPVGTGGPPPPPPGPIVSCSASEDRSDSVVVQWAPSSGQVDLYQLTRDGSPLAAVSASNTRYADVPPGGAHTYCVQAVNTGGASAACCDDGMLRPIVPEPRLDFVRDVPNDQGGKVMLGWTRSDLDSRTGTIVGYRVWRRLPLSGSPAMGLGAEGSGVRPRAVNDQPGYWEPIATHSSAFLSGYGYVSTTLQDSLPGSNPATAFFVSALTADPLVFYDSNVDSGYSVDNLAPDTPQGLQGALLASGGVKLKWLSTRAPDLRSYRVYRGSSGNFLPSEESLVGSTTDTTFVDPQGAAFYYKLSAMDVHGNESGFALLRPEDFPVATLVQAFQAEALDEGVRVSIDLFHDTPSFALRLWRSETDQRLGASPLFQEPRPFDGTHFEFLDTGAPAARVWYWADLEQGGETVFSIGPVSTLALGASRITVLRSPWPNPTVGAVEFVYTVGTDQAGLGNVPVELAIFDARGKLVRALLGGFESAGPRRVLWDGTDGRGARLPSGVYQYRWRVGGQLRVGKVIRVQFQR